MSIAILAMKKLLKTIIDEAIPTCLLIDSSAEFTDGALPIPTPKVIRNIGKANVATFWKEESEN